MFEGRPDDTIEPAIRATARKNSGEWRALLLLIVSIDDNAAKRSTMNSQLPATLLQYLHGAVGVPPSAVSDRDLIQHFLSHHDEESFHALVRRHGAMVRCT